MNRFTLYSINLNYDNFENMLIPHFETAKIIV